MKTNIVKIAISVLLVLAMAFSMFSCEKIEELKSTITDLIPGLGGEDLKPDPEQPDPEQPDPEQPDPEQPDPEQPDPEQPDPEQPDPEEPDPEQPDPEQPDPEQPDPEQPDPEQPDPEQPDPEQPDPEQPDPEDPKPEDPACEHDEGAWTVTKEAECEVAGEKILACTLCGDQLNKEVIPALEHTPGEWLTVSEAACETAGEKTRSCTLCGDKLATEVIPALEHTPGEWLTVSEATCKTAGEKTRSCTLCGDQLDKEVIPAVDHIPGVWQTVKEPTCISLGEKCIYCTLCEDVLESDSIPMATEHNFFGAACLWCGEGYESKGLSFESNGDETCTVVGIGKCTDLDIYIPRYSPDGELVTAIGHSAFFGNDAISGIHLHSDILKIGPQAFQGCDGLTELVFPEGVVTIDGEAFADCSALKRVEIPSTTKTIAAYAFRGCPKLELISISSANTYYKNVNGNHLMTADGKLFRQYAPACKDESFELPATVQDIQTYAFENVKNLKSITISEGLYQIGTRSFYGASGITEIILPSSLNLMHKEAFAECTSLVRVEIKGLRDIPDFAFYNCSALTTLSIEGGTRTIGEYAFAGCSSLERIVFPNGMDSIGKAAFKGTTDLSYVKFGTKLHTIKEEAFLDSGAIINDNGVHYVDTWIVGCEAGITYASLRETTVGIAEKSFYGASSLSEILLPESLTYVCDYAFADCAALSAVVIPDAVTKLGSYAFSGCSSLASVSLSANIQQIYNYAFENCTSLVEIAIPKTAFYIWNGAFSGCTSLETLTVEDGDESLIIADEAFAECTSLASLSLNRVSHIGKKAFKNCIGITSVRFPSTLANIGSEAFSGCTALSSAVFENTLGWFHSGSSSATSGTNIDASVMADASEMTELLTSTYVKRYFKTNSAHKHQIAAPYKANEKPASCTEGGSYDLITACSICAYVESCTTVTTEKIGHTLAVTETEIETAATCTKDGYFYEVDYCGCGTEIGRTGFTIPATGHDFSVSNYCKNCRCTIGLDSLYFGSNGDGTCYVRWDFSGKDTKIVIPATSPAGDTVTSISNEAFFSCTHLEYLYLPSTITSIGDSAFYNCPNLTTFNIPESVTHVGEGAFAGCEQLYTTRGGVYYVDGWAIGCDEYLSSITVSRCVGIADRAFQAQRSLESVSVFQGVKYIGEEAFRACSNITTVTLPEDIETLPSSAFDECYNAMTLIGSVYYINSWAIKVRSSVDTPSTISLREGTIAIADGAFASCSRIVVVIIPGSVERIGRSAFANCDKLEEVYMGIGVRYVAPNAFKYCSKLRGVYMENLEGWVYSSDKSFSTVTSVSSAILSDPYNAAIYFRAVMVNYHIKTESPHEHIWGDAVELDAPTCTEEGLSGIPCLNCDSYRERWSTPAAGHVLDYQSEENIVPSTCYQQGSYDLVNYCAVCKIAYHSETKPRGFAKHKYDNNGVCTVCSKEAVAPETIRFASNGDGTCTVKGVSSFSDNFLVIPEYSPDGDRVVAIASEAFMWQTGIIGFRIPESVMKIGRDAFPESAVVIEDGVKYVGNWAVGAESGVEHITLRSGTVGIADYAFNGMSSVKALYLPIGTAYIGSYAAAGTSITDIALPVGVSYIGSRAFSGLEEIRVAEISEWLLITFESFYGMIFESETKLLVGGELLTDLVVPESITEINPYAFSGYSYLKSVSLHAGVTKIGQHAFSGLSSFSFADPEGWSFFDPEDSTYCGEIDPAQLSDPVAAAIAHNYRIQCIYTHSV